jgi:hypothetical protein
MQALKAIVFKTNRLKETKAFFKDKLGMVIKESSARHFAIYSKGIRLVFLESPGDFEVGLYLSNLSNCIHPEKESELTLSKIQTCTDPNGIDIIIINL